MPVAACGYRVADGDGVLGEAGAGSTRRWGKDDVPDLVVGLDLGGPMRPGEADAGLERAGDIELLIAIFAPSMVSADRRCNAMAMTMMAVRMVTPMEYFRIFGPPGVRVLARYVRPVDSVAVQQGASMVNGISAV